MKSGSLLIPVVDDFGKITVLNIRHKQFVLVNLMRTSRETKKAVSYF